MKRKSSVVCCLACILSLLAGARASEAKPAWATKPLASDPRESARPCDWVDVCALLEPDSLRLAYQCAEPVDFGRGAAYCVYLDTDNDRATGFRGGEDNFPIGADFLLQGATLYRYAGSDGVSWAWSSDGEVSYTVEGTWAEFTLPHDLLPIAGNLVRIFLYGDNTAQGVDGNFSDLLPNDALQNAGGRSVGIRLSRPAQQ